MNISLMLSSAIVCFSLLPSVGQSLEKHVTQADRLRKPTPTSSVLNVGILFSTTGQRGFLQELATQFERENPGVTIQFSGYTDARYKQVAPQWLSNGAVDAMYWQGGLRLQEYIQQGKVHPIHSLWQSNNLFEKFSSNIVDVVKDGNTVYGVPFAYYSWGMLYNKRLLSQMSIKAPETWQDLLTLCTKARTLDKFPIAVGGLDSWLPAAWFDYLNMRLNGLAFHLQLLKGEMSYMDQRVTNVFEHWRQLVDADCFNSGYMEFNWRDVMTSMYRKLTAATLTASFVEVQIPNRYHRDFEFRSFPIINSNVGVFEDMPVDVFIIPSLSKNKKIAEKFLLFLARPEVQYEVVSEMSQNSPHLDVKKSTGLFSRENREILENADAVAQYFDRDMAQGMVNASLLIINGFIKNPDVLATQQALEAVRLQYINSK